MKINTALCIAGIVLLNIAGSLCQLDVCGRAPLNTKIVGGVDATEGAWPWQVAIFIGNNFCGGSLINKDWVLSAAHCFQSGTSDIVMYFGRQKQSGLNPNETSRTAIKVINHPDYDPNTLTNDLALVKLSSSLNFTDFIKPVCLAAAGSRFAKGEESWVTGWGTLQSGGQAADKLQEVMLPVVSSSDCEKAYKGIVRITSMMICAGLLNVGGKSACEGDSGGPMVSRNGSLWIQSGIVNFGGERCDDPKYPIVYARVSEFQTWITSHTGNNPPGFVIFNSSGLSSLNLLLLNWLERANLLIYCLSLLLLVGVVVLLA